MSGLVIETVGLKRSFGEVQAVKSVDLRVQDGEIYGFLGPNGAGKSTVVKMLITLLQPTGGKATVLGHDVVSGASKIRLRIGAALQDASLDEKQSGREILRLQGALYGLTRKETDVRIEELSSLIDVEAIDRWIGTYSGGMRRRLDLAASLMHSPDLLFLDYVKCCSWDLLLVTGPRLGSINHTLLSVEACLFRAVPLKGIIYNRFGEQDPLIAEDTLETIRRELFRRSLSLPVIDFCSSSFRRSDLEQLGLVEPEP
jgi:ABC-type ATPase involved in cell division